MKYGNITRFSLLTLVSLTLIFSVTNCTKKAAASVDNHHFGKNIVEKKPLTVDEVITKLKSGKGLNTQMKGTVEAVCQAKGCWMSLKSASDPSKLILVKFKDYAFFMPKDIAGKTVVVQGSAYKEVTSIEELKHYAEDEGKSKKEIDAIKSPKEEYKFMAEGVIIL